MLWVKCITPHNKPHPIKQTEVSQGRENFSFSSWDLNSNINSSLCFEAIGLHKPVKSLYRYVYSHTHTHTKPIDYVCLENPDKYILLPLILEDYYTHVAVSVWKTLQHFRSFELFLGIGLMSFSPLEVFWKSMYPSLTLDAIINGLKWVHMEKYLICMNKWMRYMISVQFISKHIWWASALCQSWCQELGKRR